jgi:hypothetical protein
VDSSIGSIFLIAATLTALAPASAQTGVGFPVVGIATGQSARVNALNAGSRSSTPDSSCSVTMQFMDARGQLVKNSVVVLVTGKVANLDLSRDELPAGGQRAEIRAVLFFGYSGGAPPSQEAGQQFDCNIIPSLEVFESSTGKTTFVLTDTKPLPAPDPRSIAKTAKPRN